MKKRQITLQFIVVMSIFMIIPLLFGIASLAFGQDINWDLRNYHFYNGYAFIENRLGYDIAPAQIQTYLNPVLDSITYILYKNISAISVGYIYGVIHGINISLILLIFLHIVTIPSKKVKIFLGISIAFISGIAPGYLSELGSSMSDNIISLFTLIVLYIILIAAEYLNDRSSNLGYYQVSIAGFIMGISVGLKLTAAIFALSLGLLLPIIFKWKKDKIKAFIIFAFTGILGFIISMGFWMVTLWQKYNNPLFPFYNNIFLSPFYKSQTFLDQRFLPKSLFEYFLWPFIMSHNSLRVNEIKFSDIRFALFFVALIALVVLFIINKVNNKSYFLPAPNNLLFHERAGNYILAFFVFSYILWMIQFSIYRYIIVLELLVPICFLLVLDRIFINKKAIYITYIASIIIGAVYFTPFNWMRIPWSEPYIRVNTTQIKAIKNADIIMLGMSPTSYVIPYFPKDNRFLRPESNFLLDYKTGLNEQIYDILHSTKNSIYLLYDKNDKTVNLERSASNLGLILNQMKCQDLLDNMPEELVLCATAVKTETINDITP